MPVSHRSDAGRVKTTFSDEHAVRLQQNGGAATAVFLNAF
jgi:hypothetical protein